MYCRHFYTFILVLTLTAHAQAQYCLEVDRATDFCSDKSNFPAKACSPNYPNTIQASAYCSDSYLAIWRSLCPKKNVEQEDFCTGKGYALASIPLPAPCLILIGCSSDDDCAAPVAPRGEDPPPFCYECCLECFDNSTCQQKVTESQPTYTTQTYCSGCTGIIRNPPVSSPSSSPVVSVTPSISPVVSVTPSSSPVVSVTPSSSPMVSVTPSSSPMVSVTPSSSPGVLGTPVANSSIMPTTFTVNDQIIVGVVVASAGAAIALGLGLGLGLKRYLLRMKGAKTAMKQLLNN